MRENGGDLRDSFSAFSLKRLAQANIPGSDTPKMLDNPGY